MTVRNLDRLFKPKTIALIGASRSERSVGAVLARNLLRGGFEGPVMPVNPRYQAVEGVLCYPDAGALPVVPDLAVIATPPDTVPDLIAELGERGCRAAIVVTAGVQGALRQRMLDAARPHLLRIVGPNCLGVAIAGLGVNATFAHLDPLPGRIACLTQSGAIAVALLDWARARGIGLSHLVSMGDMADVDFGDLLDYFAREPEIGTIVLYVEAVTQARKFMSAARIAARAKPVIILKSGRVQAGARAAASHTGAMAGSDAVYDAAFRRAGLVRVGDLDELFAAVEILARVRRLRGERVALLTNGGGMGVLATDALVEAGGQLAELAPATVEALDRALPPTWSHANPVDIIGDAPGERYATALQVLNRDPGVDAVLALNCPTAIASPREAAEAVIATTATAKDAPVLLTAWVGGEAAAEARALLAAANIPAYESPRDAVAGFMAMAQFRRNQLLLMQLPPAVPRDFVPDREAAEAIVTRALDEGREWLDEIASKQLLATYGLPVARTELARDAEAVAEVARRIGGRVAVKVVSPDILHKSDVGGVALDLADADAARAAAQAMSERIRQILPNARIAGFAVQEMVRRSGAYELICGITADPTFGPVVLFGHGGVAVEVVNDKALALPPLNFPLAHELIQRTRIARQLRGYRNRPPADLEAIAFALVKLAQLAADLPHISELDINPLLADERGVIALDARVRLRRDAAAPLAILPYPSLLEKALALPDGTGLWLRPVRPEDGHLYKPFFARVDPEDARLRFFGPLRELPEHMIARLTQIDYDREMELLAVPPPDDRGHDGEIYGAVRLSADSDGQRAEFAVIVRSDWKGRGLGRALMVEILDYARRRGIGEVFGAVLRENTAMLELARRLGFAITPSVDDADQVEARLRLDQATRSSA